jgi:hypothetical protein
VSASSEERLVGVRAKIERAKKHIGELDSVLRPFLEGEPYPVVRERDPNTGHLLFKVRMRAPIPSGVAIIAGDILNNMRAALDHLACQLVEANGGTVVQQTCFPIFKSADEYKAHRTGKVKGMHKDAVDLIDRAKPYKGGNDGLWLIHDLNRIDKHRLLLPVASYSEGMSIGVAPCVLEFQSSGFDALEDGATLPIVAEVALVSGLVMEMNDDPQFTFAVAFREPEIIKGDPMVPLFYEMVHLVERVVDLFVPHLQSRHTHPPAE